MVQTEYNNPIRQQVFLTPGMAELTLKDSFGGAMETLLQLDEIRSTRKVILTGAGDSYAAALAMLPAFGDLCQAIDASVMRLIEFTRFTPLERLGLNRPEELLVVVISAGGSTSRIIEALEKAKAIGAGSLLISGKAVSPAAQAAKHVLHMKTPPLPTADTPGLCSYLASEIGLAALAATLGQVSGAITAQETQACCEAMHTYLSSYAGEVLDRIDEQMLALAEDWKAFEHFEFLGDSGEFGSAFFGGAKVIECSGCAVSTDDTEDWCHVNYFLRDPESIGTVIMADRRAPSFSRILETVESALFIGRPLLIVSNAEASAFTQGAAVCTLPQAPEAYPWMLAMMDFIPASLLAGYLTVLRGEPFFRRFRLPDYTPIADTPFANRACFTFSNSKIEIYQ